VASLSHTALRIKSFTYPRIMLMSQNVVPSAARQGSQNVTETVTLVPDVRCSPWYVPNAVGIPKYPLNLVVIDRYIVVNATRLSE